MKRVVSIYIVLSLVAISTVMVLVDAAENPHGDISWDCTDCHTTESWHILRDSLAFTHDHTGFRLDAAHQDAPCGRCHTDPIFSHVGTACADCHADHHGGQLGDECSECHTPLDWQPRMDILNKHAERGFPLTGVHAIADCGTCHAEGERDQLVGTATECEACHRSQALRVNNPDHSQPGFEGDCNRCHHAAFGSWQQTTYNHEFFPLTGAHKSLPCIRCHENGYTGTPTGCFECHEPDYNATTDPNHIASQFSTDCASCHSTTAWEPATFDHNTTAFPLTGQHVTLNCLACHETTYAGTPSACYACHQTDYESTTDPTHSAAGFPTDCESCHSTDGWSPSTWDHDALYFPIYSGAHQGRWTECIECHTIPSDFNSFDCTVCHAHNQTDMDAHHSAIEGYVYDSDFCYDCHPRGTH